LVFDLIKLKTDTESLYFKIKDLFSDDKEPSCIEAKGQTVENRRAGEQDIYALWWESENLQLEKL
jgi:hypothetical protein